MTNTINTVHTQDDIKPTVHKNIKYITHINRIPPMKHLNGNTTSLILNGLNKSYITIMSEIQHKFSNQYWNDAIENLSNYSWFCWSLWDNILLMLAGWDNPWCHNRWHSWSVVYLSSSPSNTSVGVKDWLF